MKLGSGVLINLEEYGYPIEPTVQEEVKAGADVVCFSGDKLFGGAQAGVLVGKKKYIDQMRNHPLLRALRADKFRSTAIERSVEMLSGSEEAVQKIPTLRMLTRPVEIKEKAKVCADTESRGSVLFRFKWKNVFLRLVAVHFLRRRFQVMEDALESTEITVEEIESRMRNLSVPVIGRIKEGRSPSGYENFLGRRNPISGDTDQTCYGKKT